MDRKKISASAWFMYIAIALTLVIALIGFTLYYTKILYSEIILWVSITCFTIAYHLGVRIVFGLITEKLRINYNAWWFKERAYEKKLYAFLRVKKWKGKVLTFKPENFSLKGNSLEQIASAMSKAEVDHWINLLILLSTLTFALLWGGFWIFFATAVFAMIFDSQFIIVQRFNRPKVLKLIKRRSEINERNNRNHNS